MTFWVFLKPETSRKKINKQTFPNIMKFWRKYSLTEPSHNLWKLSVTHRFFINKKLEERSRFNSGLAYILIQQEVIASDPTLFYMHIALVWREMCVVVAMAPLRRQWPSGVAESPTEQSLSLHRHSHSHPLSQLLWDCQSGDYSHGQELHHYSLRLINRACLSPNAYQQSSYFPQSTGFPIPTDYRDTKSQRVP